MGTVKRREERLDDVTHPQLTLENNGAGAWRHAFLLLAGTGLNDTTTPLRSIDVLTSQPFSTNVRCSSLSSSWPTLSGPSTSPRPHRSSGSVHGPARLSLASRMSRSASGHPLVNVDS